MTSFDPPSRRTLAKAPMGRNEPLSCRSFDRNDESVVVEIRVVDCRILNDRLWDNPVGLRGKTMISGGSQAPGSVSRAPASIVAKTKQVPENAG